MNIIIVIFFLGILVVLHEAGHFFMARVLGMKVIKYSIGFFKPIFTWQSPKTDIIYQIGAVPLGGFVQVKGMDPFEEGAYTDSDSYQMKSPFKRGLVIVAGPVANLVTAWLILFFIVTFSGLQNIVDKSVVGVVVKDGPAYKAGLQKDDVVLTLNGKEMKTWESLANALHENPGKPVTLLIKRGERLKNVTVTPDDVDGQGLIGINAPTENVSLPPLKGAVFATIKIKGVLKDTLTGLFELVTGKAQNVQAVGPPGIVKMASSQLETGMASFLAFISYISLMLFLFNLLPIPALDGGRSVFLLYEIISRKRVNKRVDATLNTVFFFLLMGFVLFISIKELIEG
jgi:regulator of sigma E protease